MNILMMTNTYKPMVGGVSRSVESFSQEYRNLGHRVVVVCPRYRQKTEQEKDVVRVPAIPNFNGSDFSVQLPIPGVVTSLLRDFRPDVVHSHHPYLIGDTALRIAAKYNVRLVYTFHTFYERYTHYVPADSEGLKRFVVSLYTGYADLADQVFAPSESVAGELERRGVETKIDVVPTGIDVEFFRKGHGKKLRQSLGIPDDAIVVGLVSRIAPEKNINFLSSSVASLMEKGKGCHFMIVGSGPSEGEVRSMFRNKGLQKRLHITGTLEGKDLVDSYHAMDVFAFASLTETQGLVLTEAMAAGVPVVALQASGTSDVVKNGWNGRLVPARHEKDFVSALEWFCCLEQEHKRKLSENAQKTAQNFSKQNCAKKALALYQSVMQRDFVFRKHRDSPWDRARRLIKAEWELITTKTRATKSAIKDPYREETEQQGRG